MTTLENPHWLTDEDRRIIERAIGRRVYSDGAWNGRKNATKKQQVAMRMIVSDRNEQRYAR